MAIIVVGNIDAMELHGKIRREFPRQKEKALSSPKGKKGYDRKRDKRETARNHE